MSTSGRFICAIAKKDRLLAIRELRTALSAVGLGIELEAAVEVVDTLAASVKPWEPPAETEIELR